MENFQTNLRAYRNELKGAAMLWVVFFHARFGLSGFLGFIQQIGTAAWTCSFSCPALACTTPLLRIATQGDTCCAARAGFCPPTCLFAACGYA